jgi:antitoxin component of MazEF toxin-antitoxin module
VIEFEAKIKKWGNSMGLVIPKSQLKMGLLPDTKVKVIVFPNKRPKVKDILGMQKNWKKPTTQIMREIDEALDSKYFR